MKIGPVDSANQPIGKVSGLSHPWKPRTPAQIAEFAALWHNPDMTIQQVAKRYKVAPRTIQKWRVEFGLNSRDALRELGAEAATVAEGTDQIVKTMTEAGRISEEVLRAQATQAAAARGDLVPVGDGTLVSPEVVKNWNPMKNAEIEALVDEVRREARQVTQHSDLTALQRKLAKVSILVATSMPVYTWESLQTILDGLSRSVLWARKVEADIPQSGADPILLRQEAGRQMFRELKEALSPEDQAALAVLVKRGADKIMAGKGLAVAIEEPVKTPASGERR